MEETTIETPDELLARLNERFAKADVGIAGKADRLVVEMPGGCVRAYWSDEAFRRKLIAEPKVRIAGGDKVRYVPLADWWLEHPQSRTYSRLRFAPPTRDGEQALDPSEYNTWHGLALDARPGDWEFNRRHIHEIVCAGNEDHTRWLHNWIAALVQAPGEHGWVAPILKGGQGIGKGYFASIQLGGMFRARNWAHLTVPEHLTSDFNSHLEDRVYVFADEAVWGQAKVANRLKGLITETEIMINRKHVPQEIQESCLHIVIASNHDRPIPIERDDRRMFVLQVSEREKQSPTWFPTCRYELDHLGGRAAMLHYFKTLTVDWNMLRQPPESAAKTAMKADSVDAETRWWEELLDETDAESWEAAGMTERVVRATLVAKYSDFFDRYAGRSAFEGKKTAHGLGHFLAKLFDRGGMPGWPAFAGKLPSPTDPMRRENCWKFPPLADCRAAFNTATGIARQWKDGADGAAAVQIAA